MNTIFSIFLLTMAFGSVASADDPYRLIAGDTLQCEIVGDSTRLYEVVLPTAYRVERTGNIAGLVWEAEGWLYIRSKSNGRPTVSEAAILKFSNEAIGHIENWIDFRAESSSGRSTLRHIVSSVYGAKRFDGRFEAAHGRKLALANCAFYFR